MTETPGLAAAIAEQIDRHAADLRITRHWQEAAAYRILAIREIADGLRAAAVVEQLAAEHQPRTWVGGTATVCACCNTAWPCGVRQAIDGPAA